MVFRTPPKLNIYIIIIFLVGKKKKKRERCSERGWMGFRENDPGNSDGWDALHGCCGLGLAVKLLLRVWGFTELIFSRCNSIWLNGRNWRFSTHDSVAFVARNQSSLDPQRGKWVRCIFCKRQNGICFVGRKQGTAHECVQCWCLPPAVSDLGLR